MLLFGLGTIWKIVDGKFYPTRLIAQTLPFWLPFVSVDAERPHWNTVHIGTGYQKLAWFFLGPQAGAVLLGWNSQIARKMGKSHSFRWAILWIILLYMFSLNKRSSFEKKPHELSYRSNIMKFKIWITFKSSNSSLCFKDVNFSVWVLGSVYTLLYWSILILNKRNFKPIFNQSENKILSIIYLSLATLCFLDYFYGSQLFEIRTHFILRW